jgi:hypothetical protein
VTVSISITLAFISASNPSCPLSVSKSRPSTIWSFSDAGHSACSAVNGRFVRAVTFEKVFSSVYPLIRAFVMAQPVMPLAPAIFVGLVPGAGVEFAKDQSMISRHFRILRGAIAGLGRQYFGRLQGKSTSSNLSNISCLTAILPPSRMSASQLRCGVGSMLLIGIQGLLSHVESQHSVELWIWRTFAGGVAS